MEQPKPILVIRTKLLSKEAYETATIGVEKRVNKEYHVLVICDPDRTKTEVLVLNLQDASNIDIDGLKEMVLKSLG